MTPLLSLQSGALKIWIGDGAVGKVARLAVGDVQRDEQHGPDGQRDAKDDNRLWEPGLVAVLWVLEGDEHVQRNQHRQHAHHCRDHYQKVVVSRKRHGAALAALAQIPCGEGKLPKSPLDSTSVHSK